MILTLIGYRATGKTTLAKIVAGRLGWEWTDADVEVERRAGKSIARLFSEDGEPAFREIEAHVIADLCRRDRLVVATGGGAPLRSESRRAMREAGKVVWLRARPETILARMRADAAATTRRPSLTDEAPLEEIIHLLKARTPIYQRAADLVVDTDGRESTELASEIIEELKIAN